MTRCNHYQNNSLCILERSRTMIINNSSPIQPMKTQSGGNQHHSETIPLSFHSSILITPDKNRIIQDNASVINPWNKTSIRIHYYLEFESKKSVAKYVSPNCNQQAEQSPVLYTQLSRHRVLFYIKKPGSCVKN